MVEPDPILRPDEPLNRSSTGGRPRIGIVGGGPGGLMAAYQIQKFSDWPVRISIFEASDRVGGKIMTPRFDSANALYEAGAAELYDYTPVGDDPLKELVEELGLSTSPMGGNSVYMESAFISNLDDVEQRLGPRARRALQDFDRAARDSISPREFFDSGGSEPIAYSPGARFNATIDRPENAAAKSYLQHLLHSDLATEPPKTSAEYGLQNYLMNDCTYMQLYSIEGGNERLPRALAERIDATFRMGHLVEEIFRCDDGRLRLVSRSPRGDRHEDDFDYVIVALPLDHLRKVTFSHPRLVEAVTGHIAHYDHPADYLRITILFDQPFWRRTMIDSYCMLDHFGGCCLYDESSREPESQSGVLGWLLAGEVAETMSGMDDGELVESALRSLPQGYEIGKQHFVEGKVHRWLGAVNALPGGVVPRSLDRRHQPEPIDHPNLFFVGDYLFDSTLNGVLDSSEYVALWIAATIAENHMKAAP
jgi:monoamine oxidase